MAPVIWTVEAPHFFLGADLGGRMTIMRLNPGALFLHSPVRMTEDLRKELDALGHVKYVIAPNKFHHFYVCNYVRAYPGAEFYAAPGLPEKRKGLDFKSVLTDIAEPH